MKKLSVLSLGLCIVLALASCKSKESMYSSLQQQNQLLLHWRQLLLANQQIQK